MAAQIHKSSAHAAATPYENYKYCEHPVAARLVEAHERYRPSPSCQSTQVVLTRGERAHLQAVTFSNYKVRLQSAILALRNLKHAMVHSNPTVTTTSLCLKA